MELLSILILVGVIIIAAETTYLTANHFLTARQVRLAPVFVDTSVLIDGRIIAIAESGFLSRPLYIPRSVVGELQFLADNGDGEKRTRARHGLDIINQLQSIPAVTVQIFADGVRAEEGVDNRLLSLAKKHKGSVCTIDYNLNKVAVVEGIEVLNVNDLAKTLRMAYLPGEKIQLQLTQKGNDSHQAVGHLDDGTMVVVEQASKYIGKSVDIEFIRGLQTAAGKMMFAKLVHGDSKQSSRQQRDQGQPQPRQQASKAQQPKQQQQPKTQQALQPRPSRTTSQNHGNRRRTSPEDSLVELANRTSR